MLWPIGQPFGPPRDLADASLATWLEILGSSGFWHERTGSLHLAYRDDEAAVLAEYAAMAGGSAQWLAPAEVAARSQAVRPDGLKAALWSPAEVCVDPREVVEGLPAWLERTHGVRFEFGRAVVGFDGDRVEAGGEDYRAGRLWVCAGDDFETLYPAALRSLGLVRCKLQMLRTSPLGRSWRLGPMLAAGSTLRHYRSFESCPSLPDLKRRFAAEHPELDRFGIHVMAAQNGRGEVTLGDSHEYGPDIGPFDRAEIDDLILAYLATFLASPTLNIAERWHGTYAKAPEGQYAAIRPEARVVAVAGLGGAGMTLAFGVAARIVAEELG